MMSPFRALQFFDVETVARGREFHSVRFIVRAQRRPAPVTLGNGLLAWQRRPGTGSWKFSLFDFHPKADTVAAEPKSP